MFEKSLSASLYQLSRTTSFKIFKILKILKEIGNVLSNRPLSVIHHDEWLENPLSLTKRCFVGKLICLSLWIIATLTLNKVLIGRNICIDIMEDTDRNKYQWWKDYIKELRGQPQYKHTRTGADTAFQRDKFWSRWAHKHFS